MTEELDVARDLFHGIKLTATLYLNSHGSAVEVPAQNVPTYEARALFRLTRGYLRTGGRVGAVGVGGEVLDVPRGVVGWCCGRLAVDGGGVVVGGGSVGLGGSGVSFCVEAEEAAGLVRRGDPGGGGSSRGGGLGGGGTLMSKGYHGCTERQLKTFCRRPFHASARGPPHSTTPASGNASMSPRRHRGCRIPVVPTIYPELRNYPCATRDLASRTLGQVPDVESVDSLVL